MNIFIENIHCKQKYFKLKHTQEGIMLGLAYDNKINVLEELLRETGYENLIIDFYNRIAEEVPK